MNATRRFVMGRWLSVAAVSLLLVACDPGPSWHFNRDGVCPNGTEPDLMRDPLNCGVCYHECDLVGTAVHGCAAGICAALECEPGFFDADGDPDNGCECRGDDPQTCIVCRDYETIYDGRDDDCDGFIDEDGGIPLTRAHCGAEGVSCLLPPGAADVECALNLCRVGTAASGNCGTCAEPAADAGPDVIVACGQCVPVEPDTLSFEKPEHCFDGIDNDGNGRRDDGPHCEVLLANAARVGCNGSDPSVDCPPNPVEIHRANSPLASLRVDLSYDFTLDRHEVNREQFRRWLVSTGRCTRVEQTGELAPTAHPYCRLEPGARRLPASGVNWCEAYSYCQWAGKRLPTTAEWYRAAYADGAPEEVPVDAQGDFADDPQACDTWPWPVTAACGHDAPHPVDDPGGDAVIGARAGDRSPAWLQAMAIRHLTGNVSEWLFDEYVDWCGRRLDGAPQLDSVWCPAEDQLLGAVQNRPLHDWVVAPDPRSRAPYMMMCGGGWGSVPGATRMNIQQFVKPAARGEHFGFRCARTRFAPEDADFEATKPYDSTRPPIEYGSCDGPQGLGAALAPSGALRVALATDMCAPDPGGRVLAFLLKEQMIAGLTHLAFSLSATDETASGRLQSGFFAGSEVLEFPELASVEWAAAEPAQCQWRSCPSLRLADADRTLGLLVSSDPWFDADGIQLDVEVSALRWGPSAADCSEAPHGALVLTVDFDVPVEVIHLLVTITGSIDHQQPLIELATADLPCARQRGGACEVYRLTTEIMFSSI